MPIILVSYDGLVYVHSFNLINCGGEIGMRLLSVTKHFMVVSLVSMSFALAGCGSGGGDNGTANNGTVTPVQKTSIADGSWTSAGESIPGVTLPTIGVYGDSLTIYNKVSLADGKIKTSGYFTLGTFGSSPLTVYSSSGTFTVVGDTLTYTLTDKSRANSILGSTEPATVTSSTINITNTVNVSVTGNTMTWKDNNGNIVATFTK